MKKILIALMLMFSITAYAGPTVTKDMLEQVSNVTSGYRPICGNSMYVVHKGKTTVIVVRFYNTNVTQDEDPERTDMQAVFLKTRGGAKLAALTFSPIDVTPYIDLLVE